MLRLEQSDHDGSWLCLVQKLVVPTPVAIATERSALSALASSHGGEYDGWEAPILRPE